MTASLLCVAFSVRAGINLHGPDAPSNAALIFVTIRLFFGPLLISALGLPYVASFLSALFVLIFILTSPHLVAATSIAYALVCGISLAVSYVILYQAQTSFAGQATNTSPKSKVCKYCHSCVLRLLPSTWS